MAAQDASTATTATTATASRPQDWDDFNPLFDIFPQIYYNGTRLTKTANEEKFRDVLRQVQNLCLRPVKDDKRPLHLHPPSPTILVGNGPTRSAACLEVPGPPVRRTSAYVRSGIAGDLDVPEGRGGSSWNEIVQSFAHNQNIAKEFIAAPDINIVQLTEACCRKQTLEESQKLRDVLIERIALDVADRPTIFHTLLRELVYHRRIQDICTTNFDNILEYALDEKSCNRLNTATQRVHILVKNPILAPLNRAILWPGASPRAVLVHKMHGSIPLNVRPRNIDEFPDTEPITYSDHKHWGDTIVLSQRDYDAYLGELHHTFPGSLLSEALSCFTICCGKNFYTEDQTFLYALRQTQYARQAKGVVIDGERFGGIVLYTANPSMSDLLNLSTTGMLAFVVAENATISEYLRRFNGLLGPTSPFAFTDERLLLVSTNDSLSILLRVTISLMVLFDAIGINGYPELFVQQVSAIMDHLLEQTTGIVSEPLDVADELDELDLNDLEGSRGRVHSRSSSQGSVGGRPVLRNRHMSEACLSDVARVRRRG